MQLTIYQQIFELTKYKENYSKHLFDFFLVTHILFGVIYSLIFPKSNYIYPTILHTIFEIFENSIGLKFFDKIIRLKLFDNFSDEIINYTGDSFVNSLGDLAGFLLGVYIGKLINTSKYKNYILITFLLLLTLTIYYLSMKYYLLILI